MIERYEYTCPKCSGDGAFPGPDPETGEPTAFTCVECWGAGTIPTPEGNALIDFLRRHGMVYSANLTGDEFEDAVNEINRHVSRGHAAHADYRIPSRG